MRSRIVTETFAILRRVLRHRRQLAPAIEPSLQAWSLAHPDTFCQVIREPRLVRLNPPRTVDAEILKGLRGNHYRLLEKYLTAIHGVRIIGPNGLLILPDGSYASEVAPEPQRLREDPAFGLPITPRRVVKKRGSYFTLLSIWWRNYYHWIQDSLLRLYGIIDLLPSDVKFVVPLGLTPVQLESLGALGIDESRLERLSDGEVWECETLYFSPTDAASGHASPDALQWFRRRVLAQMGLSATHATRRLYLSRRTARHQRLVNETEVERLLQAYGFETILPETLSFRAQVTLFHQAEAIVAPEGAAMANMAFAPSGLRVLNIFEPRDIPGCYRTMSEALGHQYWYLLGETVENPGGLVSDIFVPLPKLQQTLEQYLA